MRKQTSIPKRKQSWKLWLGILIGAAVVGAGWGIWAYMQEPEVVEVEKIVEKEVVKEVPVPAEGEEDEGLYTTFNSNKGFSLEYPTGWKITTPGNQDPKNSPGIVLQDPNCDFDAGDVCPTFYVQSVNWENATNSAELYEELVADTFTKLDAESRLFGNKEGYFVTARQESEIHPSGFIRKMVYFMNSDQTKAFSLLFEDDWKSARQDTNSLSGWVHDEEFEHILDSFEFTD